MNTKTLPTDKMPGHFFINGAGVLLLIIVFNSGIVRAQEPVQSPQLDSHIASQIHQVNQDEIKMGDMARSKGTTSEVKNYANKIIQDHAKADQALLKIAADMKLKISTPIPKNQSERKLQADVKTVMRKLRISTGANFDQAFLKGMKDGHQEVISLMQTSEKELSPSELKDFITEKLLPNLREHHDIAMNLQNHAYAKS